MSDSAQESQKRHFSKIRPHVLARIFEAKFQEILKFFRLHRIREERKDVGDLAGEGLDVPVASDRLLAGVLPSGLVDRFLQGVAFLHPELRELEPILRVPDLRSVDGEEPHLAKEIS